MKFVCTKKNLSVGLGAVSKIISSSNSLPILNNILFKTDNGRLKLSSTNLEMGIHTWVGGKVEEEGEITIPSRLTTEYIGNLGGEKIKLETNKQTVTIKGEGTVTHINSLPPEEFPLIPQKKEGPLIKIDGKKLQEAIKEVVFAAAFSETQPEISGILFAFEENILSLVATDRYRLAERKIGLEGKTEDRKIILPARMVSELARLFSAGAVEIYIGEGQVWFQGQDIEMISRLIDGQYPDYQQIIPSHFTTEAELNRTDLIRALKAVSLFSADTNNIELELNPQSKQVLLKAQTAQIGDSEMFLPSTIIGEKNSVIFNYRYILECLNNLNDERVVFKLINPTSPAAIQLKDRDDYLYIVMPIKV